MNLICHLSIEAVLELEVWRSSQHLNKYLFSSSDILMILAAGPTCNNYHIQ
jgi:hypothetical protein